MPQHTLQVPVSFSGSFNFGRPRAKLTRARGEARGMGCSQEGAYELRCTCTPIAISAGAGVWSERDLPFRVGFQGDGHGW